jgi:hypothetical protein
MSSNTLKYRVGLRRPLVMFRHRGVSPRDVFLASYPRSGSTWLRFMLASLLEHEADFDNIPRIIPPIGRQSEALAHLPDGGRLIKTHERRDFPHGRRCRRAVYLLRDGRDVAVSYFYWVQRAGTFSGSFLDFLHLFLTGPLDGYGPWQVHVRSWLDSPLIASQRLLMVRYEDLLQAPDQTLGHITEFLGIPVGAAQIREAVEAQGFQQMRKREHESEKLKAVAARTGIPVVRSGRSGDWKDHFGEDERALFSLHAGPVLEQFGYERD